MNITGTLMHHRKRHIEKILLKRAKMFPVIGILGPRQVGKSTFLMNQWRSDQSAIYITFDKQEVATRARHSPAQLLLDESNHLKSHLIIDEAQKVPHIFDSIKGLIDENRHMGMFTLSGSIEFSSKAGVRESLAGRMGITRLYPMTMRELSQQEFYAPWLKPSLLTQPITLEPKSVIKWLERGGMPIFCRFNDNEERMSLIHSWLEAICYRDLAQLTSAKYNGELAYELLKVFAVNPAQPLTKLAYDLGYSVEAIKKHLAALESLFLLYKIPAFESPRGMTQYRLFDAGVLNALLGGQQTVYSQHNSLISLLINEIYAQYEYSGKMKPQLFHYRTRGGAEIDIVLKTNQMLIGIECSMSIDIPPYRQRGMKSFLEKYPDAKGYFIAPVTQSYSLGKNITVVPWDSIG